MPTRAPSSRGVLLTGVLLLAVPAAASAEAAAEPRATTGAPTIAGCQVFPEDSIWNARVDHLPVDPSSDAYVETIGADVGLHPDFGSGVWPPGSDSPIGIPWVAVPPEQPRVPVSFLYEEESDPGPYPIPPDAPIEGGEDSDGDRHVLVVESQSCVLWELFYAFPEDGGTSWSAGSGAVFDLDSYDLRPDGWTSADAAGLPILPGLVRYDEVAAGAIEHALRFTVPQTRRDYVWPARHHASSLTGPEHPPMGQRFRLKADFDLSGFSPDVQTILRALKEYGMMLADNGSPWYISGVPDERWDNDELVSELAQVEGSDFEAVDVSSLMIDPDSMQTAPPLCTAPDDELIVADLTILDHQLYRACDRITVGPNVTISGPDGDAVLSAGNRVTLLPGVAVLSDGRLEVAVGLPLVE